MHAGEFGIDVQATEAAEKAETLEVPEGMVRVSTLVADVKNLAASRDWCNSAESYLDTLLGIKVHPWERHACCSDCRRSIQARTGLEYRDDRFVLGPNNPEFVKRSDMAKAVRRLVREGEVNDHLAKDLGRIGNLTPEDLGQQVWEVRVIITVDADSMYGGTAPNSEDVRRAMRDSRFTDLKLARQ
jgi:hypothetical protein